jgi:hypothetical protein
MTGALSHMTRAIANAGSIQVQEDLLRLLAKPHVPLTGLEVISTPYEINKGLRLWKPEGVTTLLIANARRDTISVIIKGGISRRLILGPEENGIVKLLPGSYELGLSSSEIEYGEMFFEAYSYLWTIK